MNKNSFDILIMTTPADFERVKLHIDRLEKNLPGDKIIFVGCKEVGVQIQESLAAMNSEESRIAFLDEDNILPFNRVHACMGEHLKDILKEQEMPRKVTGWYYQQFLKMQYARLCKNDFYMTWDGDTVPCAPFDMYSEDGRPYIDLKREYHEEYFITMPRLISGMGKVIEKSFISEHLLFKCEYMNELICAIESNDALEGDTFWEKIIHAIEPERITRSAFSEFETYGSYVAIKYPETYKIRNWHSFRVGGDFFDPKTICDRDYEWLSKDFFAISFEKWSSVREDHKNLFDNPEYQQKLSARQMLEIAQEEFKDGYIEVWD